MVSNVQPLCSFSQALGFQMCTTMPWNFHQRLNVYVHLWRHYVGIMTLQNFVEHSTKQKTETIHLRILCPFHFSFLVIRADFLERRRMLAWEVYFSRLNFDLVQILWIMGWKQRMLVRCGENQVWEVYGLGLFPFASWVLLRTGLWMAGWISISHAEGKDKF